MGDSPGGGMSVYTGPDVPTSVSQALADGRPGNSIRMVGAALG